MIGLKNRRVVIERQTTTTDSYGDVLRTPWNTFATVWASIEPVRGQDKFIAMQVAVEVTHKVRIRFATAMRPLLDATTEFRIKLSNNDSPETFRHFKVSSAIDINEHHREIEMLTTESIDG